MEETITSRFYNYCVILTDHVVNLIHIFIAQSCQYTENISIYVTSSGFYPAFTGNLSLLSCCLEMEEPFDFSVKTAIT